jgi:3-oxoacyl-[acyl-carrier protein] reductase
MKLEGSVALVTGGGTGIGRAASLQLAAEGASVAVNYARSEADAEATAGEIRAAGGRSMTVQADVSDDAAVETMVRRVAEEWGRLDILVNNAGMT